MKAKQWLKQVKIRNKQSAENFQTKQHYFKVDITCLSVIFNAKSIKALVLIYETYITQGDPK